MKKTIIGTLAATTMLLAGISTSFADTTTSSPSSNTPVLNGVSTTPPSVPSSTSSGSGISPLTTKIPGSFWNLSANKYNGSFQDVSNATGIYTNYYFTPNGSDEITMDDNITTYAGSPANYNLYLWDGTTGQEVVGSTENLGSNTYVFSGLSPNDFYYIEWKANGSGNYIEGTFSVHY